MKEVRTVTRRQLAGDTVQDIETRIERGGKLISTKNEKKQMKRARAAQVVRCAAQRLDLAATCI